MSEEQPSSCFHCGLPNPRDDSYPIIYKGQTQATCCPGCQAVAQAIIESGNERFYEYRSEQSQQVKESLPEFLQELSVYDHEALQKSFVRSVDGDNIREASLILEGIVCAACVWLNEQHINVLNGVQSFRVNYASHRAQLVWDNEKIHLSDVLQAITSIGYKAHPFDPGRQESLQKKERQQSLRRIAVAGIGMMQIMMLSVGLYSGADLGIALDDVHFLRLISMVIGVPVMAYAAWPFFKGAYRDIQKQQLGMDVPVALAMLVATLASIYATVIQQGEIYFDSVTMFTFFLLVGRYLEMLARHKAGEAAESLVQMIPATAHRLKDDGSSETVAVAELMIGDVCLVRPGESLPADGRITQGQSSIDESLMTGESVPVERAVGGKVIGGSINRESPIQFEITALGQDTVLSGILRLLERAQSEKPVTAQMADRVAAWFVAVLLLVAAGVFSYWAMIDVHEAIWVTVAVLVVTCPCALSLATPAALTAATGSLTRLGVLITRGHVLERMAETKHIVFDKTGTLTEGRLTLASVHTLNEVDETDCVNLAAGLEAHSEHPIARALEAASSTPVVFTQVDAYSGLGVESCLGGVRYRLGRASWAVSEPDSAWQGKVVLSGDGVALAAFDLQDSLRAEAADVLRYMQGQGIEVYLLSGDHPEIVSELADKLGIRNHQGGLLPEDKLARIRELQSKDEVVVMVGDGVNDAPVLAGADVSVAMGGGSQIAQASADTVLLSENLSHLTDSIEIAKDTRSVIRQNLIWALIYNGVALPLAATGMVTPWMAAIGMSASSLLVVMNALRLRRFDKS